MNHDRLHRIARRIDSLLRRALGQGIDTARLLADPHYARDVLLVCDAMPGSDLASLARHFRQALVEPITAQGHTSTLWPESTGSGFGASRPANDPQRGHAGTDGAFLRPSGAASGPPSRPSDQAAAAMPMSGAVPPAKPSRTGRSWLSPGRWVGR